MKIKEVLKEGVLPGFDVFMANVRVKQPSGSVATQVAVFAKSAQMARMLLQAQYGDSAVISGISKIG